MSIHTATHCNRIKRACGLLWLLLCGVIDLSVASPAIPLSESEKRWLQQHPTIRLAIDRSWAPFEFVDEQGRYRGMSADYMALIEQKLGIDLQVDPNLSWSKSVQGVKNRELDVFSAVLKTRQREDYVNFTKPYITFPMVIVTRDDQQFIDGLAGLAGKRIAVVNNYAVHDLLKQQHPRPELYLAANVTEALQAVSTGRAFAYIGNLAVAAQAIKTDGWANLKISGQTPWRFEISMAVRKDWPEFATILQKALNSITAEQRDRIHDRWFHIQFDQQTDYRPIVLILVVTSVLFAIFLYWNKQLHREVQRRQSAEKALRESRNFQQAILDSANYSIISTDTQGLIQSFNGGAERMLGFRETDLLGQPLVSFIHCPKDMTRQAQRLSRELGYRVNADFSALTAKARQQSHDESEWVYVRRDGSTLPVRLSTTCIRNQQGLTTGFLYVGLDISEHKQAEKRLQLAQKVIDNTSEGIVITEPDGSIVEVNPAFVETMGYSREELIGNNPRLWKSGHHDQAFYRSMWRQLLDDGFWEGEIWDRRKDGHVFPKWLSINAIRDNQEEIVNFVAISTDITEQKATEQKLENLAFYDPLTRLPNRILFKDRLEHELLIARRYQRPLGVMFLDLDRFKHVNDSFGHDVGDELIEQVAQRLLTCLRKSDTVCRLGGDEFTVILTELNGPDDAAHIAQKMIDAVNQPFSLKAQTVYISTSIGIAIYPGDGEDFSSLTRNADVAMYECKNRGRNHYGFFTDAMNRQNQARMALESDLRQVLDENGLELHYQPMIHLESGTVTALEALVRWPHADHGMIMPDQFIPLAEDTGLIIPLGNWVLETACAQLARLDQQGWSDLCMSVNLSGSQFQVPGLVQNIMRCCEKHNLDPRRLQLEITESMVMTDVNTSIDTMRQMQAMGLTISIDDFGTGYSSLSHLKKFPLHSLKIDRTFIRDLNHNNDDAAIVDTIISMAKTLKLRVTAEGVENLEQLQFLRARHCDLVQGYYFSKPLNVDSLLDYLSTSNKGATDRSSSKRAEH